MKPWGFFPEHPHLDLINNREAQLERDFYFEHPDGSLWMAPEGMTCDGTSIPPLFWTLFRESPYTGCAAWAAIIHDAGCKGLVRVNGERLNPGGLRDGRVHDAFYYGMRCRESSPLKAWLFYRTVWVYGMIKGGYT